MSRIEARSKANTILFLDPPATDHSYATRGSAYPSIALLLLGTMLKEKGYNVHIIDGRYYEDYPERVADYIKAHRDEILYFGLTVMTVAVPASLSVTRMVRQIAPELPIIWGGPHPTLFADQCLEELTIDAVAINEGALAAVKMAEICKVGGDLADVPGIGYREGGVIRRTLPGPAEDIKDMPFFDFDLIEVENYLHPKISVYDREFPLFDGKVVPAPILTALGCPYKCEFCINVILERRYRCRDAASVVAEMKRLQERYGVNTFLFMDEEFFVNKKRFREWLELCEQEGLKFNWRVWGRVDRFRENYLNDETLGRLSNIGCGSLVMGGESGSQEILDMINKRTTTVDIINSLKALQPFPKITPRYSFIVGMESETLEQIRQTYEFCFDMKKIREDVDIAGPFAFRLYPGSPIYNRIVAQFEVNIPKTLDGWDEFLRNQDDIYSDMPWAPPEFSRNISKIVFYSTYAFQSVKPRLTRPVSVARYVLAKVSEWRLRKFIFAMPFEIFFLRLAKAAREYLSHSGAPPNRAGVQGQTG